MSEPEKKLSVVNMRALCTECNERASDDDDRLCEDCRGEKIEAAIEAEKAEIERQEIERVEAERKLAAYLKNVEKKARRKGTWHKPKEAKEKPDVHPPFSRPNPKFRNEEKYTRNKNYMRIKLDREGKIRWYWVIKFQETMWQIVNKYGESKVKGMEIVGGKPLASKVACMNRFTGKLEV